ncbi:MAG: ABC transporter ATP-binding protein [Lachnospiraceae bacterium]|nr:ABC transporter ATP-binding protein [Lachnospiraceae bacterium]MBQ6995284.1 ABC transporter ATP-binding protein [Lachnospiraceae bacterium]
MLLQVENVQKKYKDFALDCSLQVKEGCVTGLIGANGAGKSTLFKAILSLIKIDGGSIEILGKDLKKQTISDKEDIGVVLAENTFSCMLTVKDIISIMAVMYKGFDKERFAKKCEKYQLPLDKQLKEFSTGMKAKLKLLIAMSYDAKLLLLDEPTVGLDSVIRSELLDEMREFMNKEGRAILISSHISSDLEGLCDDFYFIQNGKIVLHDDTDVLLSEYATLKVSKEQYEKIDKEYVLYRKEENFGYLLLTKEKQFYMENYRDLVVEKGSIDDLMLLMTKGEVI